MLWLIWSAILLIVVCLVIVILFSRVYVTGVLRCDSQSQSLTVSVKLYGISLASKTIDFNQSSTAINWEKYVANGQTVESIGKVKQMVKEVLNMVNDSHAMTRHLLAKLHIIRLEWDTTIGTGEAHHTGLVVGGAWAIKGIIIGYLDQNTTMICTPSVEISPQFNRKYISTHLDCMVSVRVGQATYVLLKMLRVSSHTAWKSLVHEGGG